MTKDKLSNWMAKEAGITRKQPLRLTKLLGKQFNISLDGSLEKT